MKSKISSKTSRGEKGQHKKTHHRHHQRQQSPTQVVTSLTLSNYFYLFLYLYSTRITINNNTSHPKSPKNQNRRAALGRPATKAPGGSQPACGRPTPAPSSALVPTSVLLFGRRLLMAFTIYGCSSQVGDVAWAV